jgi:hypothetical protein
MKTKHWVLAGLACLVCLGAGFGAGMLLAPRGADGAQDTEPALGAGAPLLGAQSLTGGDLPADPGGQSPSLDDVMHAALAEMEAKLQDKADRIKAANDAIKPVNELMATLRKEEPAGDDTKPYPQDAFVACDALGIALNAKPGEALGRGEWESELEALKTWVEAKRAESEQLQIELRADLERYQQACQELADIAEEYSGRADGFR